jgi:hypothetical protein
MGRDRQKEQYDKGTKVITFQPGDMVYLREMARRKRDCPKFRLRWKGPFEVVKRLSDLNYLVRVAQNKKVVVNVNKMKRCHQKTPPLPSILKAFRLQNQKGMVSKKERTRKK